MDKEGIFRLSGSAVEIASYKEAFNKGKWTGRPHPHTKIMIILI